jgi:hypothetical protein
MKNKVKEIIINKINRTDINKNKIDIQDSEDFIFEEKNYAINYTLKIIADNSDVEHGGGITEAPYTRGNTKYIIEYLSVEILNEDELIEFDYDYLYEIITKYLN